MALLACSLLWAAAVLGCAGKATPPMAPVVNATAVAEPLPAPEPTQVCLLLPLSGPYAAYAQRILQGARLAVSHIAGAGVPVSLSTIDTTGEDWARSLATLPSAIRIVGGPMRPEALGEVLSAPGAFRRAHLAFMAELPAAVTTGQSGGAARAVAEGRDVWRFFTSAADNVDALLSGAEEVGARELGVLYPDESFGVRRSILFRQMASGRGLHVAAAQRYTPDDPQGAARSAMRLLQESGGQELGAVYIPDVWSQARQLIPNLLVLQRRRPLILGSALWAQTMDMRRPDDALLFSGSVFPGAWWSGSDSQPARALRQGMAASGARPGFWEALGFDFVRLACRMGDLPENSTPQDVTAALQNAARMDWAMAPLHWDAAGRAAQDLYLLTPTQTGAEPADMDALRQLLAVPDSPATPTTPARNQ
ncbi:ABC transporter substrate-binding protein [Oceanidesulfovibrio marinus]|nr:penicillin-binding protein activator [Oceanidesulfovibrio marinus]